VGLRTADLTTDYRARFHTFNAAGAGWWLRSVRTGDRDERWLSRFAPGEPPLVLREPGTLDLASPAKAVRMIPSSLRLFGVTTKYSCGLVDRPAARVTVAGRDFDLPAATACSGLVEGRGYGRGWAWAHAHAGDAWIEILGRFPGGRPASAYARAGRREWRLNTLLAIAKNRSVRAPSLDGWRLVATAHNRELVVDVRARREALAAVVYTGPAGETMRCWNTEVASMRAELRTRTTLGFPWSVRTFECDGSAHFEVASPTQVD